ncbi:MAG TPA: hypothetical protein VK477_13770, partial [Acidobacteriota bacterium]|nr:hypothetical protein [Acidobacteriota bacterium]
PRKVAHVRYDPTRPLELTRAAERLLSGEALLVGRSPTSGRVAPLTNRWRMLVGAGGLTALVLALTLVVSDAPFRHPTAAQPEFVLTFRAFGEWVDASTVAAAAQDSRPVHMRAAVQASRARSPVVVRLTIDGVTQQHVFRPKGLKSDGTSIGELRMPLTPGAHRVAVSVATRQDDDAPSTEWRGDVRAERGRLVVLAFEPGTGFRIEK